MNTRLKNLRSILKNLPLFNAEAVPGKATLPREFPGDYPLGVLRGHCLSLKNMQWSNVHTVGDLVLSSEIHLVSFEACSPSSVVRIRSAVQEFLRQPFIPAQKVMQALIKGPVSHDLLQHLPLYSGRRFEMKPDLLHESFSPGARMKVLSLPPKAHYSLGRIGIRSVGDLLMTSHEILPNQKYIGPMTIKKIKTKIQDLLGLP